MAIYTNTKEATSPYVGQTHKCIYIHNTQVYIYTHKYRRFILHVMSAKSILQRSEYARLNVAWEVRTYYDIFVVLESCFSSHKMHACFKAPTGQSIGLVRIQTSCYFVHPIYIITSRHFIIYLFLGTKTNF